MGFNPGQQVVYEYDNRTGIITGLKRGERWQVKFSDGENLYIPENKLLAIDKEDMFSSFSAGRFRGIDDLKRILYKYRLSGELTNILYSMSNRATRFMPHQFIPVTKFLESYTDRLLIADEGGLGKTIESYPDNLKSEHAVLFSRIEFMLNHVQIRHDQSEGDDRIERVALMSADELEHWYDETYRLILLRILEHQSEDRIRDIDELAGECGIGIETISEEEMADLLNGRLPEEESADGSPSPEEDAEEKPEGKEKDSGADGHLPESGEEQEKKPAEVRSGSSGSAKRIIIAVLVADILFVLFVLCWILFVGV